MSNDLKQKAVPAMPTTSDATLTTVEAIDYIGCSRSSFFNWIRKGEAVPDVAGQGQTGAHGWTVGNLDAIATRQGWTPVSKL